MSDHIGEATKKVTDLDALEKLADEATPGPWEHDGETGWMAAVLHQWTESGCCGQILETGECCGLSVTQDQEMWGVEQIGSSSPQDAAFIAAANPATIKALIAELKEARGLLSKITDTPSGEYDAAAEADRICAFLARNGKGEGK